METWQNAFLKAGSENSCGDLSIMISTVSEIRQKAIEMANEEAVEKVDDQLCFVPEPDAEYKDEMSREYNRGRREAFVQAKKEIKSLL